MTDERALLTAIAANPEDDTVRLAFADFLEESGKPERAEFIRNQVELAKMDLNDPTRRPLVVQNVRFLCDRVPAWRAELPQLPGIAWGDFNRGLVEEVQAETEAAIVRHAAAIFAEPAVHIIRLARFTDARGLANMPELLRVRALRLISANASSEVLQALFNSPYLSNLAILDLHGNRAGDAGVMVLASTPLPALVELWLGANGIGNAGGHALAASTHLPQLRFLDLRGNWITDNSARTTLTRRFGSRVKL